MSVSVLHVGCGRQPLPAWMDGFVETRLDIDHNCEPDVVASMTDLGDIGLFDYVYSCHSLEHLAPHDVGKALTEFRRVLSDDGAALVLVPDLEDVRPTEDVLVMSEAGPITGLDMIYGLRAALPTMPHMAHRTGFVKSTLTAAFEQAGFSNCIVTRSAEFNLMGVARK